MKKQNYFIILKNYDIKSILKKRVQGYEIDGETFVYKERSRWIVTDIKSGRSICDAKTRKAALERLQGFEERIKKARSNVIYKSMIKQLEDAKEAEV